MEDIDTFDLCRLSLKPDVYAYLETQRKVGEKWAKYPVVRSEIRTFSFDGRTTKWTQSNLFLGKAPQRMIVGLSDSTAFSQYPFPFQTKGVSFIRQIINGEEYPYVTLELNGGNSLKDLEGYRRLLEAAGAVGKHREFMLKPDERRHGTNCTLCMWNNVLSGDAEGPKLNPKQTGDVRL